jgi:release factor glutamine methyltransferase
MLTIAQVLKATSAQLALAGVPSPETDAQILLAHVCGISRSELILREPLSELEQLEFTSLVARRCEREPLQHIIGVAWFRHLELAVGPGVFIPRPETEILVSVALNELPQSGSLSVVELCAGSGAIALSIASERPNTHVIAVELSPDAFPWLQRNIAAHEKQLAKTGSSVTAIQADATDPNLLSDFANRIDAVLTNPPYIPNSMVPRDVEVQNYDPALALYGGGDGLDVIRGLLPVAAKLLKTDGLILIEHADAQGESLPRLLQADGNWHAVVDLLDYAQKPRHTFAKRNSHSVEGR